MKPLTAWIVGLAVAVLAGTAACPAHPKPKLLLPEQPDAYDQWAQSLQLEDSFYAELQRLQWLYTAKPDLALAAPNNFDGQYLLSSRIEDRRAGLVLTQRETKQQWTLWFLDESVAAAPKDGIAPLPATAEPKTEVMRDEATAGGYTLELSLNGGEVTLNIVARWIQGRYLQCTRELTLGGLDQAKQADAGQTAWTLDGAWLPYRLVPGISGPYGVVPDDEADGGWHHKTYPVEAMVPAIAMYDRTHGFMLAVSDDHPRKLDRRYDLGYAIPQDRAPGAQLKLGYIVYDGTRDAFDYPWLVSGLPHRDSVVLEPLALSSRSVDETLVEAESAEVIQHVADFVHAYHFVPKPPAQPERGAVVRADQLAQLAASLGAEATTAEGITQAAGPCGARSCLVYPEFFNRLAQSGAAAGKKAAAAADLSGIGIDGVGLSSAAEFTAEQLQPLQQLQQGGLAVLVDCNLAQIPPASALPQLKPDWFMDALGVPLGDRLASGSAGNDNLGPRFVQPDWHNPQVLAWFTRKFTDDLVRYPAVAGYSLVLPGTPMRVSTVPVTPLTGSPDALSAVFQLHLGEALRAGRGDAAVLCDFAPNLGAPAWCGVLLKDKLPPADTPGRYGRLATFLLNRVFDAQPYLAPSPDLAQTVSRLVGASNGVLLEPTGAGGFPAFATHQLELAEAAGELRVVHSYPEKNAYTGGNERPADCEEMIAILPGELAGAHAVWICFSGVGGKVSVDNYNKLTINWGGGQWTAKLPTGYWVIDHPSRGTQVAPGDAVLVQLKPIAPGSTPERPLG